MFATDFIFNGQSASDFDLIIASIDGDNVNISGGEIEYNVVKTPNRDSFTYYTSDFNTVLEWEFSVMKNTCYIEDSYFTQDEESMIANWLLTPSTGYHWLHFEQDTHSDMWYKAVFQMTPVHISGKTVGFNLKATSNCGYGWSDEIVRKKTMCCTDTFNIYVNNDMLRYTYPTITITSASGGNFYISNDLDEEQCYQCNKQTEFKNLNTNTNIVLDCDNEIVSGINADNFNFYYPRLLNGTNVISTNSPDNIEIIFKYRETRRVIV